MIYAHKIIPLLVSPLFITIILLFFGAIFKKNRTIYAGLSILIICSLPIISNKLISYLESGYTRSSEGSVKTADAIIVLSGMVRTIKSDSGLFYEWNEASDRIFSGINLMNKGKAPLLILTGGKLPWSIGKPEGEYLSEIAILQGISTDKIQVTEDVQNTDQEAKAIAKLLNQIDPKIILVTSAFHMPRAKKVFEAAGFVVSPFPVDFLTSADKVSPMDFIPSAEAFEKTSFVIRELIGRLYYELKY